MSRIRTIIDIAERLEAAFRAERCSRLKPVTALIAATALRAYATQPDRDEIAKASCRTKKGDNHVCEHLCMTCIGQANVIQRMYRGEKGL